MPRNSGSDTHTSGSGAQNGVTRRTALRTAAGTAGAAGLVGLAGCVGGFGGGGSDDPKPSTLTIGLTRSNTGSYVYSSTKGFRGVKLWQRNVNENGGIEVDGESMDVELVTYDDRSSKQRVTRLYETLINEDNVDVLFAPFGSTLTSAAAAVASKNDKFLMAWSAADPSIYDQGYDNLVSSEVPSTRLLNGQFPVMKRAGVKSIAVLHLDAGFTSTLADTIKREAPKKNIEVVHNESYAETTSDFSSTLRDIDSKDPDAFFVSAYTGGCIDIMRQMKENDVWFDWVHSYYSQSSQFYNALGPDAMYAYGAHNIHPDLKRDVDIGLSVGDFISQYREMFGGDDPQFGTTNAYSAGLALGEAVKRSGATRDTGALVDAAVDLNGNTLTYGPWDINPDKGFQKTSLGQYITPQNQHTGGSSQYERFEVVGPNSHVTPTADPAYPAPGWNER